MRAPGDVLLVSTYALGHAPVALASAAAFLERAGFDPDCLDAAVDAIDDERLARARVIALSVPMHTALRLAMPIYERARRLAPTAKVGFFGVYATLHGEELVRRGADFVLGGECEQELVAVVDALERGTDVAPWCPAPPTLDKLAFPVPSRRRLPLDARHVRMVDEHGVARVAGQTESSRGCLHLCRHCPIPAVYARGDDGAIGARGRFFVVPADVVLADVAQLVDAGATHVTFADPDFLNGPRHAIHVARALHARFPAVTFDVTAKVEHLLAHQALLPELRALGCAFVVSAVESLSDVVLARLAKGHDRADVEQLITAMATADLPLRPTLLPFTPWSTLADHLELLELVDRHGLQDAVDPVQLAIRLLLPAGSLLLDDDVVRAALVDRDAPEPASFTHRWRHADPRLDALHATSMAIVEDAAARDAPAVETHARLRAAAGLGPGRAKVRPTKRVPHLTEPWFC